MQLKMESHRKLTKEPSAQEAEINFGREICGVLEVAEQREWLVTNGIGGFASGTVSGNLTRRYHGLLVAALNPPLGRNQLVAKVHETARYDGADYALATNRWESGAIEPKGYLNIEFFWLDGTTPVWQFAIADALLEKRIWMADGQNTTCVQYTMLRSSRAVDLEIKSFVNYRDFHSSTHAGDWRMNISTLENGVQITAFEGATPFYLLSTEATCEPRHEWYRDCFLLHEKYRGLDDHEDHLLAAVFRATLQADQSITLVFSTNANAALDGAVSGTQNSARQSSLLQQWSSQDAQTAAAPGWMHQLVLAADQFIVKRALPGEPDGRSIIAGYHWFGDWGRDTMIALPGLTLATGRADIAKKSCCLSRDTSTVACYPTIFPTPAAAPNTTPWTPRCGFSKPCANILRRHKTPPPSQSFSRSWTR